MIEPMSLSTTQILAIVRIVLAVATIAIAVRNRRLPNALLFSAPYTAWLLHGLVYLVSYLTVSLIGSVDPKLFNLWSSALHMQGYMTVLCVEIIRWRLCGRGCR